jgi:AbrB family looped-hinge helix DNA binding protein
MTTTLSTKGQLVIPSRFRQGIHLQPGDQVSFSHVIAWAEGPGKPVDVFSRGLQGRNKTQTSFTPHVPPIQGGRESFWDVDLGLRAMRFTPGFHITGFQPLSGGGAVDRSPPDKWRLFLHEFARGRGRLIQKPAVQTTRHAKYARQRYWRGIRKWSEAWD